MALVPLSVGEGWVFTSQAVPLPPRTCSTARARPAASSSSRPDPARPPSFPLNQGVSRVFRGNGEDDVDGVTTRFRKTLDFQIAFHFHFVAIVADFPFATTRSSSSNVVVGLAFTTPNQRATTTVQATEAADVLGVAHRAWCARLAGVGGLLSADAPGGGVVTLHGCNAMRAVAPAQGLTFGCVRYAGGLIRVLPYGNTWPEQFALERDRMVASLAATAVRIEHVGSTAVPGLAAKPWIDIQLEVPRLEQFDAYGPALFALGYQHHPDGTRTVG